MKPFTIWTPKNIAHRSHVLGYTEIHTLRLFAESRYCATQDDSGYIAMHFPGGKSRSYLANGK